MQTINIIMRITLALICLYTAKGLIPYLKDIKDVW